MYANTHTMLTMMEKLYCFQAEMAMLMMIAASTTQTHAFIAIPPSPVPAES
jgi:hypothetical protein